jgi:TRAP-type C4-dicarboxylate transport system substrate-binding protein
VAPSLRVMRIVGLFQGREETRYVMQRLRPRLDAEFAKSGLESLGLANFGIDHVFLKKSIHTFAELKEQRLWVWDMDVVMIRVLTEMGMQVVPLPLYDARAAADAGKIDGFFAIPSAMLSFQWSTRVKYFLDVNLAELPGCLVIASRALDRLPAVLRDDIRGAAAKFTQRFEEVGRFTDEELLNGLFQKQGLQKIAGSESFRSSFFTAARAAREKIGASVVPRDLIEQVLALLADFRAEHPR